MPRKPIADATTHSEISSSAPRKYLVSWAVEGRDPGGHVITGDPIAALRSIAHKLEADEDDLDHETFDVLDYLRNDGSWHGRVNLADAVLTLDVVPVLVHERWTFQQVLDDVMREVLEPSTGEFKC